MKPDNHKARVANDVLLSLDKSNDKAGSNLLPENSTGASSTSQEADQTPIIGQNYFRPSEETRAFLSRHLSLKDAPPMPEYCSEFGSLSLAPSSEQVTMAANVQRNPPNQLLDATSPGNNCDATSQPGVNHITPPTASSLQDRITKATTSIEAPRSHFPGGPTGSEEEAKLLPYDQCHSVHYGAECEKQCRWCSSLNPKVHALFCPLKDSNSRSNAVGPPSQPPPKTAHPTSKLSLECQRRGFNPEYVYQGPDKLGRFTADLYLRGSLVSGNSIMYMSERAARDALATRGLEKLRDGKLPAATNADKTNRGGLRGPPPKYLDHITPPNSRADLPAPIPSSTVSGLRANGRSSRPSHDTGSGEQMQIDLPGNISAAAVPGVLSRVPRNSSITINLPANVSVDVAQAYGRGLSMLDRVNNEVSSPPRRRFRSRSASPIRDRDRAVLDFDRRFRERNDRPRTGSYYRPFDRAARSPQAGRLTPPRGPRRTRESSDFYPSAANPRFHSRLSSHPHTGRHPHFSL